MSVIDAANRLAKWRRHFTNWQLGGSEEGTKQYKAVANHREMSMLMRAEINGITRILIDRKVISAKTLAKIMEEEYDFLSEMYSQTYPGITAVDSGLDIKMPEAMESLRMWND